MKSLKSSFVIKKLFCEDYECESHKNSISFSVIDKDGEHTC